MKALILFCTIWLAGPLAAATCENIKYLGNSYSICRVNAETEKLRLFLNDDADKPFGNFNKIASAFKGQNLTFAMNAGMYHEARDPVGLYVEQSKQITPIVTRAGPGNFGLLPNGVFCINEERADVIETLRFAKSNQTCTFATQSGPMLVIDGKLHPRFLKDSTSRYTRNGVGNSADGRTIIFAISNDRVTFHEFGSLFKDHLKLPNALYFDGNVSQLHAPSLDRSDRTYRLGPIVGILE